MNISRFQVVSFVSLCLAGMTFAPYAYGMEKRALWQRVEKGDDCFSTIISHGNDREIAQLFKSLRVRLAPDFESKVGVPFVYSACAYGRPKLLTALLAAGADPNARTLVPGEEDEYTWSTPLARAVIEASEPLVEVLLSCPATDLYGAGFIRKNSEEVVEKSIDDVLHENVKRLEECRATLETNVSNGARFSPHCKSALSSLYKIGMLLEEARATREGNVQYGDGF